MKIYIAVISLFAFAILSVASAKAPKNVIYMISDGCGYNHIKATNLYQHGKHVVQSYENFPVNIGMSTYPAFMKNKDGEKPAGNGYAPRKCWESFDYVLRDFTCSAAAATAMATGEKTVVGYIGLDHNKKPLKNLTELAIEKGKSAGVVTSVPWAHATPAGFVAHNISRKNYSDIAKQMLHSKLSVIMGCGHPYYSNDNKKVSKATSFKYVGDSLIWKDLINNSATLNGKRVQDIDNDGKADAWKYIESREDFLALAKGKNLPKRVLGTARVETTLQEGKGISQVDWMPIKRDVPEEPMALIADKNKDVPDLEDMAIGALNVLNQNDKGFFLMIEGGAIDWAAHSNLTARMIVEEMYFNNAVDKVSEWVEKNSSWEETLLIVTADHETGYLTAPYKEGDGNNWIELPLTPKGTMPKVQWNSDNHSNSLVPFFAKGAGSDYLLRMADETDPVRGKFINNTEPAQMLFMMW